MQTDRAGAILQQAIALYRAGRGAEAAGACATIIGEDASNAAAMHLLGVIHNDHGQYATAADWVARAIAAAPAEATYRNTLGVIHERAGRFDLACEMYRAAMSLKPDYVTAYNNLGAAMQKLGRTAEAVELFRRAQEISPGDGAVRFNLGAALQAVGDRDEAEACYEAVLRDVPGHIGALVNLGILKQDCGRLPEAESYQRRALALNEGLFEAAYGLGITLRRQGRFEEAIGFLRRAAALRPGSAEAAGALGNTLRSSGSQDEAMRWYRRATELGPRSVEAWVNLSGAQVEAGDASGAAESAKAALGIDPSCAPAMANLGSAYVALGRATEAVAVYRESLRIDPGNATAHGAMLLALRYVPDASPEDVFAEHVEWGMRHGRAAAPRRGPWPNPRDPGRRLRVGYLSADFCRHPVSKFVAPILAGHNRGEVEVWCYADERRRDDVTAGLSRAADGWRTVTGMSDAAAADVIARDGIDILVELGGHTRGSRLGVLAHRPAPVQVTYLGYCGTSGMPAADYRLTDAFTDPAGEERYYTERLERLPGCFCCFAPPADAPDVSELPALSRGGGVTFGSLNGLAKINPLVLDLWARVLRAVPGSRLLIWRDTIGPAERVRYAAEFASRGIDAARVDLRRGERPSGESHLRAYDEIDVALDVFPFSGHTTACEAVWMGAPVVTLLGKRHAGRMVAGILRAAGFPDFVAESPDEFVDIAVRLAGDLVKLADFRRRLRPMVAASALCDAAGFCHGLEAAYRRMWRGWCEAGATVP